MLSKLILTLFCRRRQECLENRRGVTAYRVHHRTGVISLVLETLCELHVRQGKTEFRLHLAYEAKK